MPSEVNELFFLGLPSSQTFLPDRPVHACTKPAYTNVTAEAQKAVTLSNREQVLIPAGSFLAQVRSKQTFIFQQSTNWVFEPG